LAHNRLRRCARLVATASTDVGGAGGQILRGWQYQRLAVQIGKKPLRRKRGFNPFAPVPMPRVLDRH